MKYKVGDRVKIKSLDWYNENKSKSHGTIACVGKYFEYDMREWCGKIMTILTAYQTCYIMEEDGAKYLWTDEMIEGLVEEETLIERVDDKGLPFNEWLSHKGAFHVPDGYELKDENGNVINATKIVLEKKKKEYPKTYEECCKVLHYAYEQGITMRGVTEEEEELFRRLIVLKRCRDAYWKIAGDEMGLGKPWEPDWTNISDKYCIYFVSGNAWSKECQTRQCPFAFPTPEMRDDFKENFDPDIEFCKELL